MYGFIYLTTNLVNGKKYIGKRSYQKNGWENYIGSGKLLRKAISKYGKISFKREILEECETHEKLNEAEKKWIIDHNAVDNTLYYNLVPGGGGVSMGFKGKQHSTEHKEYLRQKYSGKKRPEHVGIAVGNAHRGIPLKEEHLNKLRQSHPKGANHPLSKSIILNGVKFDTITQASKETGIPYNRIRYAAASSLNLTM